MRIKPALLLSCVLLAVPAAARARRRRPRRRRRRQTAPPPPDHAADCAPTSSPNGNDAPERLDRRPRRRPLGDKLARSDGVLCPPSNVDPAMRAPAPETGKMPVIPPPGSPGGDPSVRPK